MRKTLKELLKESGEFNKEELKFLPRSFDVIGNIALIQIPKQLEKKKKIIGNALLGLNKNVKAVYCKGKHYGKLRKQQIELIAGLPLEETICKESGCIFKLNVKTCFFSPRLATDRLEIAKQVKQGEKILVMFSGVAPYAIVIAKNAKPKEVTCIELGKEACKYAEENVKINKLNNIKIIQGDVKKVARKLAKLKKRFDRIVMPRPQLKYDFLQEAFLLAKKGTIIHFHDFVLEKDIEKVKAKIERAAKKAKRSVKILRIKKVREIAPYKLNIRVDFMLV
ncbi:MAG: hypothetical protein QXL88_02120 [Candidatus Pacearchaeota archaeon]